MTKNLKEDPYTVSSKRRNPIIADVFSRMNLMERRGSGLKKIIDIYSTQENYREFLKPDFFSTQSSFIIVLKNLNHHHLVAITEEKVAITEEKVAITEEKVAITETKRQERKILEFASRRESFKTKEIEELLQVKSARARKILSAMVKEGSLVSQGENRNRRYRKK